MADWWKKEKTALQKYEKTFLNKVHHHHLYMEYIIYILEPTQSISKMYLVGR